MYSAFMLRRRVPPTAAISDPVIDWHVDGHVHDESPSGAVHSGCTSSLLSELLARNSVIDVAKSLSRAEHASVSGLIAHQYDGHSSCE